MRCPQCNGANLSQRKEFGPDPYDFTRQKKEGDLAAAATPAPAPAPAAPAPAPPAAPAAEADRIKICPYCGKSLDFPEVPRFCPYCEKQILN